MNDFVKWSNRAILVLALLLVVIMLVINNGESNAIIIMDILKWTILLATTAVAVLNGYVKYKNNPADSLSELRVMAITIISVVGVAFCIVVNYISDTPFDLWKQWLFWTCVVGAVIGSAAWIMMRRKKE